MLPMRHPRGEDLSSQWFGLFQDATTQKPIQAFLADYVHLPSQASSQIDKQGAKIEETPIRLHFHEEVYVARFVCFPAGYGTKDPHVAGAMRGRNSEDFLTSFFEQALNAHGGLPSTSLCRTI